MLKFNASMCVIGYLHVSVWILCERLGFTNRCMFLFISAVADIIHSQCFENLQPRGEEVYYYYQFKCCFCVCLQFFWIAYTLKLKVAHY